MVMDNFVVARQLLMTYLSRAIDYHPFVQRTHTEIYTNTPTRNLYPRILYADTHINIQVKGLRHI